MFVTVCVEPLRESRRMSRSLRCMVDSLCCCARLNSKLNVLQVELESPELADSLHLQQVVAVLGQQVLFILMKRANSPLGVGLCVGWLRIACWTRVTCLRAHGRPDGVVGGCGPHIVVCDRCCPGEVLRGDNTFVAEFICTQIR